MDKLQSDQEMLSFIKEYLKESDVERLAKALKNRITEFRPKKHEIKGKCLEYLSKILIHTQITRLYLRSMKITDESLKYLKLKDTQVTFLDLGNNEITLKIFISCFSGL